MTKLVLLSVVIGLIVLPMTAAREPDARRGLRRALVRVAALNAVYAIVLALFEFQPF